ncbi:hypothetical protein EMIHUDRAFT_463538 [Emiliania huxleyi CCMP1516]|uniref:BAR domain-containing protein n=2 Tax=Emiliania huxleyi TaxID=2903 RepID=A0A0D3JM72_EMIH1|nr:hypothetical protein EMIHUDRAFT_463538 [Emiliania huxleyi CCMP1516]EOD24607.1 hypothetical protein EMIHUDRAFT_463538 [Emiliania huxleyi CCMP1516]|eukprot:XP_005777036.1 hypothetical protein EMIHUDRAFT_463538 [Emiliania huxleyi CCMP1516]
MHKLASLSAELKSKVQDAGSALSDVRSRVTQQVIDAAGGGAAEEDEIPELQQHVLYRNVFQPVRREVEGRKDFERRLADRKKERLCSRAGGRAQGREEAFRRKQVGLLQSDPTNKSVYEGSHAPAGVSARNLEAAAKTFARHSEGVARDVAAVNAERQQMLSVAFAGLVLSQLEFFSSSAGALEDVVVAASAGGGGSATLERDWARMRGEMAQLVANAQQQQADKAAAAAAREGERPTRSGGSRSSSTSQPLPDTRPSSYVPPATPSAPASHAAPSRPSPPPPPPPPPAAADPFGLEGDLLGGGGAPPQARQAAVTPPPMHEPSIDLLGGGGTPASSGSAANLDLMGGSGGSAMDDLFAMAAPPALTPTMAAPTPSGGGSAGSNSDFDDWMNGGKPAAAPARGLVSGGGGSGGRGSDLMGGMGGGGADLLGGMGSADLLSGMGNGRPAAAPGVGRAGSITGPDGRPLSREQLAARREAEKQAAIAAKVQEQRAREAKVEADRDREHDLEKTVTARVQQWQRDKKNLRALLASLHEIAPPCSWKPMTLGQLIEPSACKKAYHKALLAVLAQHIFDALRDAWHVYQQTG